MEAYHGIEKNVKEIEDYVSEITEASREDFLHLTVDPGGGLSFNCDRSDSDAL